MAERPKKARPKKDDEPSTETEVDARPEEVPKEEESDTSIQGTPEAEPIDKDAEIERLKALLQQSEKKLKSGRKVGPFTVEAEPVKRTEVIKMTRKVDPLTGQVTVTPRTVIKEQR